MPRLFAVSTRTFILLSLCTFGLYELYWSYRNWKQLRIAGLEDLRPFWRAVFAPLWGFSLFKRIRATATAAGVAANWQCNLLGTLYLLFAMARMLPEPWSLISLLGFVAIIPVQRTAQRVNAQRAVTGTQRRLDTDGPPHRDPVFAPPSLATAARKPWPFVLIAVFLGCWILMAYIGNDIANWLPPEIQVLLWAAVATTGLGLLAALLGRPRLSLVAFALSMVNLLWQGHLWDLKLAQDRKEQAESVRNENRNSLSRALLKAPCDNGDIAVLTTSHAPWSPRISMNLRIVHPSHTQSPETWESTSGEGDPPDKSGINKYRQVARTECRQPGHPSLDDLHERLRRHYWAEHHKDVR
ncbi:MAG: hypothetical protein ACKO0M_14725 [Cyanobium sp.]